MTTTGPTTPAAPEPAAAGRPPAAPAAPAAPAGAGPELVIRSRFSSGHEDEITDFIGRMYADNDLRFAPTRNGARFSAQTNDVPAIGADRVRSSLDYTGTSQHGFQDYVFFVLGAGTVQITSRYTSRGTHRDTHRDTQVNASRGDAAMYPLATPITFDVRGVDIVTLRLPARQLHRYAEETTGLPAAEVHFHDLSPVSAAMSRYWRSLTALTSGALMDPASPATSPLLAEQMARAVAIAAIHTFPNTTMTRQHEPGPGTTAPATTRRALAYLEAHAHEPVQLSDVAAAAGTSARALQAGFRRHLDFTPLDYLKQVRLERAHRQLQAGDPAHGDTVAAIAARWGFSTPGRFAAAYRDVYGVLPSHTLRH